MNKYIIIFIIILIILTLIFFIKKNNEHYSAESLINIFAPCRDNRDGGTVSFNNVNISGALKLGGTRVKNIQQYILDIIFPLDSFYVQYPHTNSKDSDAFPPNMSPARLFGGEWQEQWPEESIFFRTSGSLATENRVDGFQNYANKRMTGDTTYSQADYDQGGRGTSGIFDSFIIEGLGTDKGRGNGPVTRAYFDISGFYNKNAPEKDNNNFKK